MLRIDSDGYRILGVLFVFSLLGAGIYYVLTRVSEEQAIVIGRTFFTQINIPTGQVVSVSYTMKQPDYYWYDLLELPRPSFDSDMPRACWMIEYEQPQRPGHVVIVYVDEVTGICIGGIQCK